MILSTLTWLATALCWTLAYPVSLISDARHRRWLRREERK